MRPRMNAVNARTRALRRNSGWVSTHSDAPVENGAVTRRNPGCASPIKQGNSVAPSPSTVACKMADS